MSDAVTRQLLSIQSMLSSGHRNLRIERHTLLLWGLAGGGLLVVSDWVFTPQQIPSHEMRAFAWLALLTAVLGTVGLVDLHLTRRAKRQRDETWSFVHRQVLKVWWLLMAMGTLLTFATFFFGGGYMVCAAWMILLGIGLYVHGLFSEELLEWIGATAILVGAGALAARLPYEATRWIAASVSGLGLPLLAGMLDHGRSRPFWHRLAQTMGWIAVVLGVPLAVSSTDWAGPGDALPRLTLDAYRAHPITSGPVRVLVPAGTVVPVTLAVTGDLLDAKGLFQLPLITKHAVEVLVQDGEPTESVRIGDGPWANARGRIAITIPGISVTLDPARGPAVDTSLNIARLPAGDR
ncbi:hypothetical protein [Azospirillum rugosum]|uniref:MFS transporter permease n=1 Tax=Azospirillum rugosum TaxID=416170 RepID=A0ABS4SSW7_9PROT|nr:hypothetical protein [Azospirillum rugosum]MBP2295193.1 hypothetical protein [Azospirillum rugosum]MDQ0528567.1 hypothetical protein [Azospirillum rugosum]